MLGAKKFKASFVCGGARLCEPQRFEMHRPPSADSH